ncbi:uncharacterized protein LOC135347310 isoform X2 [Halichondria panicea]|uniref:uncharacterized protein LOC135347310 isoform X2 n=1 Tax=Halichondria panicea TaxID=6063 RepID=UPI00312B702D
MQWILRSSTARSFEGKWSPKIRPPYEYDDPEDLEDDIPLVFHMPSWQLRASLASVLITPVLYQLYLIMITIRYILFLQTFSSPPRPACPVVDLSWTGVFPCELGWRGSALAVLILSAVLITCYSLITACLVRWNPRKRWNIQHCITSEKPTKFKVRVQSTNHRPMLPPTLSLCILLLIFRLLLQSGDVEANPGPTLGSILMLSDLNSVYKNLIIAAGNWVNLGLDLGLGHGTLDDIKDDYHRNKDCLREMLAVRLKTGPLTYFEICQSLRAPSVDRNDVAEAIEEACTGFKQHFEEAMKDGFVTLKTVNVILMGPAGSGKTSVKDLVLNNEVKEERNSTGPLDRTIQVRSVSSHHVVCKGKEWKEITPQDMKRLLSEAISQYKLKDDHKKSSTSAAEDIHDHSQAAVNAVVDDLEEISSMADSTSIHKSGEELFGTMTIRVTDSGGQPQFHDIAPLFTQGTSAGIYVMKLTDKFNDYPSDECYIEGQQVGTPSLSHLSHRETILSLIQSLLSVNTHEKKPRCIFVGTFKDAFKNDPPSILSTLKKKNQELHALIPECFRVYRDRRMTQLIFELNAISRDEDTQTIAQAIRNVVEGSPFFEDDVPLRWFALELSLQEYCTQVGRRILTRSECVDVAKKLQSHTDDIESALEYFDKICIVHYYPQKLPGIVFVDPQVPLEIINDLVRYAMSLREGGEDTLPTATQLFNSDPIKLKLLRDGGVLTLDILESEDFKKHFWYPDHHGRNIFAPKHMIELMKELLVISPLTNSLLCESTQFFMPALLKSIPRAELKNCCINEPSVDPLLVRFTNGCIRAGVFCCLVVFLMKTRGWERYSKSGEQVPQARNCIKLRKKKCFVTLVDSIAQIEVYVNAKKIICENLCPKIKEDILEGIRASQEALHYSINAPEICFFCPCIYGAIKCHHAEVDVDYTWNCSEKPDEYDGKLENKHLIWFEKKNPGGGEHFESQHLTVDNVVREVGIKKEVLDQHCSSELLQEIGRVLPNWLKYAQALLSKAQIQGIKTDANLDNEMKGQKVLEIWHNECNTSYRTLVDICLTFKDGETARRICEIVKEYNLKRKREDTKDDEDSECSASRAKKTCQPY